MNQELVKSRFLQMVKKKEATPFRMFLDMAVSETERLLRPEYAEAPPDLVHTFAAALAVKLWTAARCAEERLCCTEGGTLPSSSDSSGERAAAEVLVSEYRALCRDYLRDEAFVMMGIPPKRRRKPEREVTGDAESDSSGDEGTIAG